MTSVDLTGRDVRLMRNYVLLVLGVVSFLNYVDRQILTILLEAVKRDLRVSDTSMGLLSGTAFALFYAAASLPVAHWADRGNRRSMLAGAIAIWSIATAACGTATHWAGLAAGRATVAVSESAAIPVSHSMLADLFPPQRRATVFGILMAAGSVGIAAGLSLGGWANAAFGWRAAFMILGLPGLLVALVLRLTVSEPVRIDHAADLSGSRSARDLIAQPLYRSLLALAAIGSFITYSTLGWSPTFLIRVHGLGTAEIGLKLGLATGVGNALGHYLTGLASDRLATRDLRWYTWLPAGATTCGIPFGFVFLYTGGPDVAIFGYGLMIFLTSTWLMPLYALAYRVAGKAARARASAMIAAAMSLIGLGLGPLLVGVMNDRFAETAGPLAVQHSLTVILLLNLVLVAGFVTMAGQVRGLTVGKKSDRPPPPTRQPSIDGVTGAAAHDAS